MTRVAMVMVLLLLLRGGTLWLYLCRCCCWGGVLLRRYGALRGIGVSVGQGGNRCNLPIPTKATIACTATDTATVRNIEIWQMQPFAPLLLLCPKWEDPITTNG